MTSSTMTSMDLDNTEKHKSKSIIPHIKRLIVAIILWWRETQNVYVVTVGNNLVSDFVRQITNH